MTPLERFEAMEDISRQMLGVALANDWDALVHLEARQARHRDALSLPGRASLRPLPADQVERIADLIRSIQANDRRIMEIVEPVRESLHALFARRDHSHDLDRAYGAFRQAP